MPKSQLQVALRIAKKSINDCHIELIRRNDQAGAKRCTKAWLNVRDAVAPHLILEATEGSGK